MGNQERDYHAVTVPPNLHSPLLWKQQPAKPGAVSDVGGHHAARGIHATEALIRGACTTGACQLDHHVRAEGWIAAALLGAEGLPSLPAQQLRIGAER
jgi:hypothetical protein